MAFCWSAQADTCEWKVTDYSCYAVHGEQCDLEPASDGWYAGVLVDQAPVQAGPMTSGAAIRGCNNYSQHGPIFQSTADSCFTYCEQYGGAAACEWEASSSGCYVEFGSGCAVTAGFNGWFAALVPAGSGGGSGSGSGGTGGGGGGGGGSPLSMQEHSAAGCDNWSWWSPIYQPDSASCGAYCGANAADACEWDRNSGDCYVEFGDNCQVFEGYGGWDAGVKGSDPGSSNIRSVSVVFAGTTTGLLVMMAAGLVGRQRRDRK